MTRPSTRPPSQNPVFLNSHSKQPVSGQFQLQTPFFASRGCWLTKASDVQARRKSLSPYNQWLSTAPVLASPQTSFGVCSSRIHFSPTDRGGEKNAWRTNPKGRLQGGYICLGSWLMGRLSLRLLVSRSTKQNLFFRQEILRKRAGGEVTSSQGLRTFPL